MKPIKVAVAVLLTNPESENEFLIVKRPPDDDYLPNVFGLPAVSIVGEELSEDAVRRVGKEKLCTDIEPTGFYGIKSTDRETYTLILMDIEAKLAGEEPDVTKAKSENTTYTEQKWTGDLSLLKEAASKGSLCSQIVLDKNGVGY